jgi:hypothetical protein
VLIHTQGVRIGIGVTGERLVEAIETRGGGHALSLRHRRQRSFEIAAEPEPVRIGLSR